MSVRRAPGLLGRACSLTLAYQLPDPKQDESLKPRDCPQSTYLKPRDCRRISGIDREGEQSYQATHRNCQPAEYLKKDLHPYPSAFRSLHGLHPSTFLFGLETGTLPFELLGTRRTHDRSRWNATRHRMPCPAVVGYRRALAVTIRYIPGRLTPTPVTTTRKTTGKTTPATPTKPHVRRKLRLPVRRPWAEIHETALRDLRARPSDLLTHRPNIT